MEANRNISNVAKGPDLVNEARLSFWYLINYDIIIDLWIIFPFLNGLKGIMSKISNFLTFNIKSWHGKSNPDTYIQFGIFLREGSHFV